MSRGRKVHTQTHLQTRGQPSGTHFKHSGQEREFQSLLIQVLAVQLGGKHDQEQLQQVQLCQVLASAVRRLGIQRKG